MTEVVQNQNKVTLVGIPEDVISYTWVMKCIRYYREHWYDEQPTSSYYGVIFSQWDSADMSRQLYIYKTKTGLVVKYSLKE